MNEHSDLKRIRFYHTDGFVLYEHTLDVYKQTVVLNFSPHTLNGCVRMVIEHLEKDKDGSFISQGPSLPTKQEGKEVTGR